MATMAEMRAEELVFEVADELGLTEGEVLGIDMAAVADGALRHLRTELKKLAGRTITAHDYFPSAPPPGPQLNLRLAQATATSDS